MDYIPLALRLADSDRIGYYMIGWDQISVWDIPGYSQAQVFLPKEKDVKILLEEAVDKILIPSPLTDQVRTLEAQLTAAHQATASALITKTPTITPVPSTTPTWSTPSPSLTLSPTNATIVPTATPTPTTQGYP
jgi:hypothetical protein